MTLEEAFASLPELATDRLVLRQIRVDDANALFAFRSDADFTGMFGQEPNLTVEETKAWIERSLAGYWQQDSMTWAIVKDSAVIGEVCLWNFSSDFTCAEVGYELSPLFWGKGLMKEALAAVLEFGFADLGLHRIEADPLARNERSRHLLAALGFKYEGTLSERVHFRGEFEDQTYYAILEAEYRRPKRATATPYPDQ
jgi:ribosomal-protein-alanine N-acetyltransferase